MLSSLCSLWVDNKPAIFSLCSPNDLKLAWCTSVPGMREFSESKADNLVPDEDDSPNK